MVPAVGAMALAVVRLGSGTVNGTAADSPARTKRLMPMAASTLTPSPTPESPWAVK